MGGGGVVKKDGYEEGPWTVKDRGPCPELR